MSQRPSFRDIAPPLDVDDGALKKLADHMNVPVLHKPDTKPAAHAHQPLQDAPKPEPPSPPAPTARDAPPTKKTAPAPISRRTGVESFTIELPAYLIDAVKGDAIDRHTSARYVVMLALRAAGFAIDEADMVPDARRRSRKTGICRPGRPQVRTPESVDTCTIGNPETRASVCSCFCNS